jgi:hypothetical protein
MGVLIAPVAVEPFLLDLPDLLFDPPCSFRRRLFRSGRPVPALVLLPVGEDSEVGSSEGILGSLLLVLRRNMMNRASSYTP